MMKTVSVHIVTFNSKDDIEACIQAVRQQTYPNIHIIVVDNASTDGTRDCLRRYSGIECIYNSENIGFAPAHNQAISQSQADYMLVLNPDVTLEQHYIERLVHVMEQHPSIGSCTGKLLLRDQPEYIDSTGLTMGKDRRARDRGANEAENQWSDSGYVFGVSGAAALYSSAMIQDISLGNEFFDASFFAYKEDVDIAWRAQLLGWDAWYEATAVGYHARGWKPKARRKQPLFIRQHSYINRYRMMFKNDHLKEMLPSILRIISIDLAMFGYAVVREPQLLKVWSSFIGDYKKLKQQRTWIQSRKKRKVRFF